MEILKIRGGKVLSGEISSSGAKNAITKMIVATLLSDKKCIFTNVPNIHEVAVTLEFCKEIGMIINWDREAHVLEVQTPQILSTYVPQRFSGANRIPILMIGALLARTSEDIVVPTVGGCNIGKRSVDFHLAALEKLGATIEYRTMKKDGAYFAQAHSGLKGSIIEFPYPSVGATENTILAATKAEGTTVIKNASIEPEVIDLILFLQKMGAHIHVDTGRTIVVQGVKQFNEVSHYVIPDRIEIASFAMAAIATKGRVFIRGAVHEHLMIFLNKLRELGAGFTVYKEGIEFFYQGPLKGGIHVETDVYPGFLTDWQQPFVVLLTQCEGTSIVHETVYENRFGYMETLKEMGANSSLFCRCLGSKNCRFESRDYAHSLVVTGITPLIGKDISIPDLRAGFAYIMAALLANGESVISNLHFLDRGYEKIDQKLLMLGADIERVDLSLTPSLQTKEVSPKT